MGKDNKQKKLKILILDFFIIANLLLLLTPLLFLPFVGPNYTNQTNLSFAAQNLLKFGFGKTLGLQLFKFNPEVSNSADYYINHPPFFSYLLALFFKLFGEKDFVAHLVSFLFSSGSLILMFLLSKKWFVKGGMYFLPTVLSLPIFFIYFAFVSHEPITLFFILLTTYSFLKNNKKWLPVCLIAVFLGSLTDWPMVEFCALLFLISWIFGAKDKKKILLLFFTSLLSVSLYFVLVAKKVNLLESILTAASKQSTTFFKEKISLFAWLKVAFLRLFVYLGPAGSLGLLFLAKNIFKKGKWDLEKFLQGTLLLQPLFHVLFFPKGSWGHPFWWYYFVPAALFGSLIIINKIKENNLSRFLWLVLGASFCWSFFIFSWKVKQVIDHKWQVSQIKLVSDFLKDEKEIFVSPGVEEELVEFYLKKNAKTVALKDIIEKNIKGPYLFLCWPNCSNQEIKLVQQLQGKYPLKVFAGRMPLILFDLKDILKTQENIKYYGNYRGDFTHPFEKINLKVMQTTKVPQF